MKYSIGDRIKNLNIKSDWKISFFATVSVGLVTHIFLMLNYLPNSDTLYSFYSDQNVIRSGRWFLSIACGISSYFDLPWVCGLISILFISLTSILVIELFEVTNKYVIIIISALLVSCPSVTEIFFFIYTADGYMIAMFMATLSVYIIKTIKYSKGFRHIILHSLFATILMCLSLGIYQAYFSFALVLGILVLLLAVFRRTLNNKSLWCYVICFFASSIAAVVLYYVTWKICMSIQGVQATSYQGIDSSSISASQIINGFKESIKTLFAYYFERNIFKHGIGLYGVLNILFLITMVLTVIVAVKKTKVYNNTLHIFILIIGLICLPISATIWHFVSFGTQYSQRMLHSMILVNIFVLVLAEEYIVSKFKEVVALLMCIMCFNFALLSNIASYNLHLQYERSFEEAVELKISLQELFDEYGKDTKVAIIGDRRDELARESKEEDSHVFIVSSMMEGSLLFDSIHTESFLYNVFNFEVNIEKNNDVLEKISSSEEYSTMSIWPESEAIKYIDDTIVIKYSN